MEEIKVSVLIQSLQTMDTGKQTMTQRAEGLLRQTETGWLLTYQEGEDSGLGATCTTLCLDPGRAVLARTGEVSSRMVFQPGQEHTSLYETAYGKLPMTIRTLALKAGLTQDGGRISIHYQIELGGGGAGETRLRLTLQKKENSYDR